MMPKKRLNWKTIIEEAATIVERYDTLVTLRQLFYQLVSAKILPNLQNAYKALSDRTAKARRAGEFPALLDRRRRVHELEAFEGTQEGRQWLSRIYRRDRTEGQEWSVYIGVEKHGLVQQRSTWFEPLGLPILSIGGYASQTYTDDVSGHVRGQDRDSVLIYAGDFDPSGIDIPRDFVKRVGVFDEVRHIALSREQVEEYDLPRAMGKATDSRAAAFVERCGELVQVELDALSPDTLRDLYQAAIAEFWDVSAYEAAMEHESQDRRELKGSQ